MSVLTSKLPGSINPTEFDRWWGSAGLWVEPANQRRAGESGVQLLKHGQSQLYCKRQTGHLYRTFLHPFGRPTILRELHTYRAFARLGIRTPNIVYCSARQQKGQWQALLVTEALQGFVNMEQWYASNPPANLTQYVLRQLGLTLARMHLAGWQHGCCYPKHIFVRVWTDDLNDPRVEIALLDLEKSRRRWRVRNAAKRDLGQLNRHRGNIPEADLLFLYQIHQQTLNSTDDGLKM